METNKKLKFLGFKPTSPNPMEKGKQRSEDLGNGSQVLYIPKFLPFDDSWKWLDYLNNQIPWTRPSIRVFGRSCVQPRDTCYIATEGLPMLKYSGYQPHAYSWDEFPPLKLILAAVHEALPGSGFNSLLLNRYLSGSDYVAWHSDDEKLYGPTPEIASVSFGCEREFLLRKKPSRKPQDIDSYHQTFVLPKDPNSSFCVYFNPKLENTSNRLKGICSNHHSFMLKHGSLLVMRGYTQRDWLHSIPKRAKADAVRINLTFRCVQI